MCGLAPDMHGRPRPGTTTSRSAGGGAPGAGRSSVGAGRSSSSREAAEALHALAASDLGGTPPAPPVGAWVQGTRSGRAPGADGGRGAAVSGGRSGGTPRPPGALSERYDLAAVQLGPRLHTARRQALPRRPSIQHAQVLNPAPGTARAAERARSENAGTSWPIKRLRNVCESVCACFINEMLTRLPPRPSPATRPLRWAAPPVAHASPKPRVASLPVASLPQRQGHALQGGSLSPGEGS